MNYISIILARGGSKGITHKNLKKVGNYSLIERAIITCKKTKSIKHVYVSTEDKKIEEIAKKSGAIIVNRPKRLAGDKASSEDCWIHCLNEIKKNKYFLPDRVLFVQCTSPFIKASDIDKCFKKYEKEKLDCCFSVKQDSSFLWKIKKKSVISINHNYNLPRSRRQDLEEFYKETGAFYLVKTKTFILKKNRFFGKIGFLEVENDIDIDDKFDLKIARNLISLYE